MTDQSSDEATPSGESPDDTKRKFREALDRKKAGTGGGSPQKDGGTKQVRAHGPAESRRDFRRKSI